MASPKGLSEAERQEARAAAKLRSIELLAQDALDELLNVRAMLDMILEYATGSEDN